jgi:hypothetical protein
VLRAFINPSGPTRELKTPAALPGKIISILVSDSVKQRRFVCFWSMSTTPDARRTS